LGFIKIVKVRNILFAGLCFFIGSLAWAAGVTSAPASQPAEGRFLPEISRFFPIWTQGYLEVRDIEKNFDQLRWLMNLIDTPAEGAAPATQSSQPASDLAGQFDSVLRQNLKISSKEFLKDILGQHFVVGWGGPLMRDQFGLICRVKDTAMIGKLLTANKAEPQPPTTTQIAGKTIKVRTYRLPQPHISVAVIDDNLLILATTGGGEKASMFHGMIDLARGLSDKSLRQNPNFQAACTELKPNYASLFVILTEEKGTLFSGKAGSLFDELRKNVSHIAIFSYPAPKAMDVHVDVQPRWLDTTFLPELPLTLDPVMRTMVDQRTDFVYVASIDPYRWYRRIAELADQGQDDARQYREMVDLALPDPGLRENLLETLGPEVMLVISSEPTTPTTIPTTKPTTTQTAKSQPAIQRASDLTAPQFALVVKTHNPTLTLDVTDQIFNLLAGFVAIQNFATGSNGPVRNLRQENYHGFVLNELDLGQIAVPNSAQKFPGWKLGLTWTQANDYLMISSSTGLLRQLLDRAFIAPRPKSDRDKIFAGLPDYAHWAMSFDPGKAADDISALREVLIHLGQNMRGGLGPQTAQNIPVVLGIGTKVVNREGEKNSVVQVAAVLPSYPAWRKLQVGDIILSVNDQAIDPASPRKDLHQKINSMAPKMQSIKMKVLRAGKNIEVEIPLTYRNFVLTVKSMQLLHKILNALARNFDQIELACTYTPQGRVHIVFDFISKPKPSAASQPTKK
jgi:hypothetical protein